MKLTTLTTSGVLGFQSSVCVEVGADGVILTLPLAATATVGDYVLEICDTGTGSLTLEPTGADTLNYRTDSQVITGQGSQMIVRLMGETNWSVTVTLPASEATPWARANAPVPRDGEQCARLLHWQWQLCGP